MNLKLSAHHNSEIPVIGKCSLNLDHKNELFNVSFLFVDTKSLPILGLESCENLKLIKRICSAESKENSFLPKFSDCFRKIGPLMKLTTSKLKKILPQVSLPSDESLIL